jgi:ketosteroid isomerase-like protein
MSQENVEIVRAAIDAVSRGEVDVAFKAMAPDCEFDVSRSIGFDAGVKSSDQGRDWIEGFIQSWESIRIEADDFIEAGEDVVVSLTTHATGRGEIEVQARPTWVWTFRGGAVVRLCLYQDLAEALEAVGLRE